MVHEPARQVGHREGQAQRVRPQEGLFDFRRNQSCGHPNAGSLQVGRLVHVHFFNCQIRFAS